VVFTRYFFKAMKVLHLSTSDIDGGAARAAYRLHQGLVNTGIESKMLVRAKFGKDPSVISNKTFIARLGSKLDTLPLEQYSKRDRVMFSPQWFPDSVVARVKLLDPDIVHLHWTCNGFLKIESLAKLQKPIVWTLHDMWAFTGGCHYTQECDRYTKGCGMCPQLGSTHLNDLSRKTWLRKSKAWSNLPLTIATPSQWMAQCAESSPLFEQCKVECIQHGVETQIYKPIDQQLARHTLNLPKDKLLVLFGAGSGSGDPRKGFKYLLSALQQLNLDQWGDRLELVIFGESRTTNSLPIAFKTHYLGRLEDDSLLALAYSSVNVFVAPSVQDNFPNTVLEALACGVPCVAFNIGGMPDMIDHLENGFLAVPFDVSSLADGITRLISDPDLHYSMSINARAKVMNSLNIQKQSAAYLDLYRKILKIS
jgi:glycosyltransferase involved in cell wall biosynthesis